MKTLERTFQMNADKSGLQTFEQVARNDKAAVYSRLSDTGRVTCYEVFVVKIVKAGSPLPGGGHVEEDYESYPGKSSFGRTAWAIAGTNPEETLNRAMVKFNELTTGHKVATATAIVELAEIEIETETTSPKVRAVRAQNEIVVALKIPTEPFSQKDLAAFNNEPNYKKVYSPLQKMLANGMLKVHETTRESSRGKSAKLFMLVKAL